MGSYLTLQSSNYWLCNFKCHILKKKKNESVLPYEDELSLNSENFQYINDDYQLLSQVKNVLVQHSFRISKLLRYCSYFNWPLNSRTWNKYNFLNFTWFYSDFVVDFRSAVSTILPDVFWQVLDKYFKFLAFPRNVCLFSSGEGLKSVSDERHSNSILFYHVLRTGIIGADACLHVRRTKADM